MSYRIYSGDKEWMEIGVSVFRRLGGLEGVFL